MIADTQSLQENAKFGSALPHSDGFSGLSTRGMHALSVNATTITPENRRALLADTPFFFRLVGSIFQQVRVGTLIFQLPDGRNLKFVGEEETDCIGVIRVHDYAIARRSVLGGDVGFFESYADDQWSTPDLATCLYVLARNTEDIQAVFQGNPLFTWLDSLRHTVNRNSKSGSKRNIMAHYDLGNEFYEQWLDPTMTYSSAIFDRNNQTLQSAQQNKYENLARNIQLKPGEHVLEIGSGWGGFAEFAAKEVGATVTGVTISKAQYDYASARLQSMGLNDRAKIELRDYRDLTGQYDKIASIEMFEAVGKAYWPVYFDKVRQSLRPGGIAGLQIITVSDRLYEGYEQSTDFIQRYVFPGGMLPSPSIMHDLVASSGLNWQGSMTFGQHYADTLREWHRRFLAAWETIQTMGFDGRFKKIWQFYLAYCEAGFRAASTNVYQIAATKP